MTHKKAKRIKITKVIPVEEDKHLIQLEVEGAPPLPTEPLPVEHIISESEMENFPIHTDDPPPVMHKTWKEWFASLFK